MKNLGRTLDKVEQKKSMMDSIREVIMYR